MNVELLLNKGCASLLILPRSKRRRRSRFAAYLYIRFQVSKGCKRRSLAVMSGTRITRIPLDPMALRGGYLAGRRGITDEANPYQAGAPAALAWRIGWVSGLKKQLRVMYGGRSVFTGRFRTRPFLSSQ